MAKRRKSGPRPQTKRATSKVSTPRDPTLPEGWPPGLKPWRDLVTLRDEIRQGRFEESEFAASLIDVALRTNRAAARYENPYLFFQGTALTAGLRDLLVRAMRRVSRQGGDGVIQLQTPFGGGKTHTLLALYHIATGWDRCQEVDGLSTLAGEAGIEDMPPIRVVAFAGHEANALQLRADTPESGPIYNLWGEIAYQLATSTGQPNIWPQVRSLIENNDYKGINPGVQTMLDILDLCGPSVILLDELVAYANALADARGTKKSGVASLSTFYDFLQSLTEAASRTDCTLVVATLVDHKDAGEPEAVKRLQEVRKRFGRVEQTLQPVEGDEIFDVIRRRLFEDLGADDTWRPIVAHVHDEYVQAHNDYPSHVSAQDYRDRMERAYPFHPELIFALRDRWGGLANFQRTRGVLRLLAMLLSDRVNARPSLLVQPSHVGLGGEVRQELLKFLDSAFQSVVDSDLAEKAGAARIDDTDPALGRWDLAQGLARAIFVATPDRENHRGADIEELRLATWEPGMHRNQIESARDRLVSRLYYLHDDAGTYYFDTQANLNLLIDNRERSIRDDDILETIRERLREVVGQWPGAGGIVLDPTRSTVADRAELTLVVLDPSDPSADQEEGTQLLKRIWEKRGDAPRVNRNALVFLGARTDEGPRLTSVVRNLLALESVRASVGRSVTLSAADRASLKEQARKASEGLPARIADAYSIFHAPDAEAGLRQYDLGQCTLFTQGALAEAVWNTLTERQRIAQGIAPARLLTLGWRSASEERPIWPTDEPAMNAVQLVEYFSQLTYLPMLANRAVLQTTISQGVNNGEFGIGYGDGRDFQKVYFREALPSEQIELVPEVWLLRPEEVLRHRPKAPAPAHEVGGETPGSDEGAIDVGQETTKRESSEATRHLRLSGSIDQDRWDSQMRDLHVYIVRRASESGAQVRVRFQVDIENGEGLDQKLASNLKESLQAFKDTSDETIGPLT